MRPRVLPVLIRPDRHAHRSSTLLKPEPPDPTITTGQTITVAVHVGGQGAREERTRPRPRLLLRHNPVDPNYEEIADGGRRVESRLAGEGPRLPRAERVLVQGRGRRRRDARVRGHRSHAAAVFTNYEASYEYPAYTRKPDEKATGPNIRAYKGTKGHADRRRPTAR